MKNKLEEIKSLHSVIDSAWLRIEWLDEALVKVQSEVAQAEEKYDEVVARQEQLMHEVAKQAVLEGIAGVDDHLPMLQPVDFFLTMDKLLARHSEVLPINETLH